MIDLTKSDSLQERILSAHSESELIELWTAFLELNPLPIQIRKLRHGAMTLSAHLDKGVNQTVLRITNIWLLVSGEDSDKIEIISNDIENPVLNEISEFHSSLIHKALSDVSGPMLRDAFRTPLEKKKLMKWVIKRDPTGSLRHLVSLRINV